MAVLIPLKAGGNIQGHCDLNDIFLSKKEKSVENLVLYEQVEED